MKKIFTTLALIATLALGACGKVVTVPPAYEGKILTSAGYAPDTYPPSTLPILTSRRLD